MQIDVPNFLLAASVTQAVVLSSFLLLPSNIGQTSNKLLVIALLSIAAEYAELFLYGAGVTVRYPNYAYVGTLISVLQPPAIFLYTKSLMYRGFEIEPRHSVHLIPFFVAVVVFFFSYYLQPAEVKTHILMDQDLPGMPTSLPLALVIHGVFLSYLIYSVVALRKFAARVRNIFTDIESKQISWLKLLLSGYAVVWMVSLTYCLSFYIFKRTAEMEYVLMFAGVSGFIFINMLVINALKQSVMFSGLTKEEAELLEAREVGEEKALPTIEQKNHVEQFMEIEKPFLNANLSLNQLAKQMKISPRDLSFVINHGFDKNFFDFVSDYRIRHAAGLLDLREEGKTIQEVMYESGFNSKSVFNTAFKQKTGITPTQYRKRNS
ncbi:MAG: helix-turn-helix domain-containing protein [Sterolibacterium sp.]